MVHNGISPAEHGKDIIILCFGDEQDGAEGFDLDAWDAFVDEYKSFRKQTPNTYVLQLGDAGDFVRMTVKDQLEKALNGDISIRRQMDNLVRKQSDKIIERYCRAGLEGRFLGIHDGHHNWQFATGETITSRIASAMRTTNLGWIASHRINWQGPGKNGGTRFAYTMISTHGNANARKTPGALAWMENNLMPGKIADHYIMGHACKNGATAPFERSVIRRRGPLGEDQYIPRCLLVGGFHAGYTNGWTSITVDEDGTKKTFKNPKSSYVERAGFTPQPLMWGVIRLKVSHSRPTQRGKGLSPQTKVLKVESYNSGPGIDLSVYQ